jgi:hypothetical protein
LKRTFSPSVKLTSGITMSQKNTKIPDSDVTARKRSSAADDPGPDANPIDDLQTSNKSGKHSSVKKLAASRPEFAEAPGAHPKAGAFGDGTPNKGRDRPAGTPGSEGLHGRPGGVSNKVRKTKGGG